MTREEPAQFLLMRHRTRWDLPKGYCEPGETFIDAAMRETHEETGITPEQIALESGFEFRLTYPVRYERWGNEPFMKTVCYFLGWVHKPLEIVVTEHESAQWFEWDPPHQIQEQTIDPLLNAIAEHLSPQA